MPIISTRKRQDEGENLREIKDEMKKSMSN